MVARVALRTVKLAAAAGDRIRPPQSGVVILIYHRVGRRAEIEIDLPAEVFDRQMAWLSETGRAVTLETALDLLLPPERGADRPVDDAPGGGPKHTVSRETANGANPVVVTFDDGTADLVDVALPILVRHGVPATVYLATRHVDEALPWPDDGLPLSWSGAREMLDSGLVTIGSHTHSHALLDRLPADGATQELDRSRRLIEDNLGVVAEHFAYPKAVAASPEVETLVQQRFRSAALGGNRPNPYGRSDPHRLCRSAVQVSDGMEFFRRKANGGLAWEDSIRRAINRIRYRGLEK